MIVMITPPEEGDCRSNYTITPERHGVTGTEDLTKEEINSLVEDLGYEFNPACSDVVKAERILDDHRCDTEGYCDPTSGTCYYDGMSYVQVIRNSY